MGYKCIHYDEGKCKKLSDATVMVYCHEGPCGDETFPEAEWIPVEEELPEMYQLVIVHYESGTIDCGCRFPVTGFLRQQTQGRVTHWMPLPKPPEIKEA